MEGSSRDTAIVTLTRCDDLWTRPGPVAPSPRARQPSTKPHPTSAAEPLSPNAILNAYCNRRHDPTHRHPRTCDVIGGANPASSAIKNRLSQRAQNPPRPQLDSSL